MKLLIPYKYKYKMFNNKHKCIFVSYYFFKLHYNHEISTLSSLYPLLLSILS